jgi:hypothetical protein
MAIEGNTACAVPECGVPISSALMMSPLIQGKALGQRGFLFWCSQGGSL